MKIYLHNLGCARNVVDGEVMLGELEKAGHRIIDDATEAEAIVVNTCGFIESAAEESVDAILELAGNKQTGNCRKLVVTGCLPQRYRDNLTGELPEVDTFLGTGAYDQVLSAVNGKLSAGVCILPEPASIPLHTHHTMRMHSTYPVAYIKVMEGCNRHCTYCIIPKLRGKLRSRHPDDVISEVRALADQGFSEIVIIGQDTTSYGDDIGPDANLANLLGRAAQAAPGSWIRFLYGHPDRIDDALLETMGKHPNICHYFDIPIQHVSAPVLKRMGRGMHDHAQLEKLFNRIRSALPEAALRTTVMVGFPGETESDFHQLSAFIQKFGFDHLGAFVYSDADDLASHTLSGHIPAVIAEDRMNRIMALQADISLEKNEHRVGRELMVLVEEDQHDGSFIGRTMFQAPEVDGITVIYAEDLSTGKFIKITITNATEYDLEGVPA